MYSELKKKDFICFALMKCST